MPVMIARDPSARPRPSSDNTLDVALVNNMPDGALRSTERQFLRLLSAASHGVSVRLHFYALPGIARSDRGRRHVNSFYSPLTQLWDRRLDGIIVTGTEPRAASLRDEPYWPDLARLIDWAEENTQSAVWSCLAAHAAVLHLDGIARRRLSEKRFGLFPCDRAAVHPLTGDISSRLVVPHSRWNDLPEHSLADCGYDVLTRVRNGGVDCFAKQQNSLFVFFQGHPEYDGHTLGREYLRDVGRYLNRETDLFPRPPQNYFPPEIAAQLAALADKAASDRESLKIEQIRSALAGQNVSNTWRSSAAAIYSTWLSYIEVRKADRSRQSQRLPLRAVAPRRRLAAGA